MLHFLLLTFILALLPDDKDLLFFSSLLLNIFMISSQWTILLE